MLVVNLTGRTHWLQKLNSVRHLLFPSSEMFGGNKTNEMIGSPCPVMWSEGVVTVVT